MWLQILQIIGYRSFRYSIANILNIWFYIFQICSCSYSRYVDSWYFTSRSRANTFWKRRHPTISIANASTCDAQLLNRFLIFLLLLFFRFNVDWFENLTIVASNDINEDTIHSLNQQVNYLYYLHTVHIYNRFSIYYSLVYSLLLLLTFLFCLFISCHSTSRMIFMFFLIYFPFLFLFLGPTIPSNLSSRQWIRGILFI